MSLQRLSTSLIRRALGGILERTLNYVCPEDFGAVNDRTADNTAALQSAWDYARSNDVKFVARGTYRIFSPLYFYGKVQADFTGSRIIVDPSVVASAAITFDEGGMILQNMDKAVIVRGLQVMRPLASTDAGGRINFHADTSSNMDGVVFKQANNMKCYDWGVYGFRDALSFQGKSCYLNHFFGCNLGMLWRYGASVWANNDSNENYTFVGGSIFNVNNPTFNGTGFYIDSGASQVDIGFRGTSFDYCDISMYLRNSYVECSACHFENNNNNAHIICEFTGAKAKPTIILKGGTMGGGPGITYWTGIPVENPKGRPGFIEVRAGGSDNIIVDRMVTGQFREGETVTQLVMVAGNNTALLQHMSLKPLIDSGNSDVSTTARGIRLSDAWNFLRVNNTLDSWTKNNILNNGEADASISSDYYDDAFPHSRMLSGNATRNFSLTQTIPIRAGENYSIQYYYKMSDYVAGEYNSRVDYLDQAGNVIGSSIKTRTGNAGWTHIWHNGRAPNGCVAIRFQHNCSNFNAKVYGTKEFLWIW